MKYIDINNKKYPFKATLTALRKFEEKFDKSFSQLGDSMRVDELLSYIYFCMQAGAKIDGCEIMSYEDLSDSLDVNDIQKLSKSIFQENKEDDPN